MPDTSMLRSSCMTSPEVLHLIEGDRDQNLEAEHPFWGRNGFFHG